jgi:hypothetical protein
MIALALHEIRIATRGPAWPVALVLNALACSLFVAIWGPTGGVPLWRASPLEQLAAVDRVIAAVVLTWFATHLLADDETGARRLVDWSALTGRSTDWVFRARAIAVAILAAVFTVVGTPAFVAAADLSAVSMGALPQHAAAALGFAALCLGVTAIMTVVTSDRIVIWCTAMIACLIAAVGVRLLDTMLLRAAVPAAIGTMLVVAASASMRSRMQLHGR